MRKYTFTEKQIKEAKENIEEKKEQSNNAGYKFGNNYSEILRKIDKKRK